MKKFNKTVKLNADEKKHLIERVAQITAHRVCHSAEHDPANGKLHGYCVVCGTPWPCDIVRG